jgi:PAS domain S-box-containing protein
MPEIDDKGEIIGYIGVVNDITKRKLAEQALIESEENFRSFIESAPIAIVISDINQKTKYINKKFLQLFGYTIDEHPNVNEWWGLAYPDETYRTFCRNRWAKAVEEAMQTKSEITPQECFISCKDGEIKFVEISFVSLGVLNIVTFVDLTDRKKAEKLLAEAEERYRTVFENTVVGLYRTTLDGEIILANPALLKMLGFSSFKEMKNRRLDRNGFDTKYPRSAFLEMMQTKNEIIGLESAWKKADGSTVYVKESAKAIKNENGEIIYFEGVVENITQQKLTELELNAVESKYETIFINANDAILLMDKDAFIECNPRAEMMFGCSSQELLRAKPIDFSPPKQPDGKESSIKSIEKITAALSGIPQFFEWQHKKKDGTLFDAEVSLNSVVFREKTYIQAMVRDVSDRKKAEQELSNSENQFRSVWEKSFDGMRLLNEEGIIVLVNSAFCEIVDMQKKDLIGKPATVVYIQSEQKRIQNMIVRRIQEIDIEPSIERNVTLHDGRKIWLEISNSFIEIGSSRLLLSVFRDISHRKNLIAELFAAKEKAEEMNRVKTSFFANMSHELRTPLIGILGFSELLKDYLDHNSETYKMAQTVHSSGTRLLETLNNILRISKIEAERVECKLDNFNIIPLIKDVIKLFQPAAKYSGIDLLFDCVEEEILCYTDDKLFHEIMNNLVHNAIKFSGEGCITVEVKKEKEFAVINVIDNGIGIPADKQDVIWEAFRQVSEGIGRGFEGTGLGLTISKRYTELIKGKIHFVSEEGKGSTFTVEVPLQV